MATATNALKKTRAKKKAAAVVTRGKRKRAIARCAIKPGTGMITVNGIDLRAYSDPLQREIIGEPLSFDERGIKFDYSVVTAGGGIMGQAQACRTAIARAIVAQVGDEVRTAMTAFDKSLLVEDPRRVEPKKFKGPKARARFTKSYR